MYKFYLFVLFITFLLPAHVRAEGSCKTCTIDKDPVTGEVVRSPECEEFVDVCVLNLGDNLGILDLYSFADLRNITINVGDGTYPILNAGAAVSKQTFIHVGGDNVRIYLYAAVDVVAAVLGKADIDALNLIFASLNALICLDLTLDLSDPFNLDIGPCTLGGNVDLPVELIAWTATATDEGIRLDWSTEIETDADYFEVMHSPDGRQFSSLGRVTAAGNTAVRSDYSQVHDDPAPGINYYRLEQVDFDGTRNVFNVRSVEWEGIPAALAAYPNPAGPGDRIRLTRRNGRKTGAVQLISSSGRMVGAIPVSESGEVQLPGDLAGGLYLLRSASGTLRVMVRD